MIQTYISHKSTLNLFASDRKQTYPNTYIRSRRNNMKQHYNKKELDSALEPYKGILKGDIDLLIPNNAVQHNLQGYKFHRIKYKIPKGSFLKLDENIYISSPEFMFCQLAETCSWEQLALIGMEICGRYSIDPQDSGNFVNNCMPITTPKKISNYIKLLKKDNSYIHGLRNAEFVATLLSSNSYSPQESRLFIILTAPHKVGGFGIKNLVLNQSVSLSKESVEICGQDIIFPDISNPDKRIAIEYDSDTFHDDTNQNRRDKLRINALKHDKWNVFNFVTSQIHSKESFFNMAIDILKANGQESRIRNKSFNAKFNELYNNLYNYS